MISLEEKVKRVLVRCAKKNPPPTTFLLRDWNSWFTKCEQDLLFSRKDEKNLTDYFTTVIRSLIK